MNTNYADLVQKCISKNIVLPSSSLEPLCIPFKVIKNNRDWAKEKKTIFNNLVSNLK